MFKHQTENKNKCIALRNNEFAFRNILESIRNLIDNFRNYSIGNSDM